MQSIVVTSASQAKVQEGAAEGRAWVTYKHRSREAALHRASGGDRGEMDAQRYREREQTAHIATSVGAITSCRGRRRRVHASRRRGHGRPSPSRLLAVRQATPAHPCPAQRAVGRRHEARREDRLVPQAARRDRQTSLGHGRATHPCLALRRREGLAAADPRQAPHRARSQAQSRQQAPGRRQASHLEQLGAAARALAGWAAAPARQSRAPSCRRRASRAARWARQSRPSWLAASGWGWASGSARRPSTRRPTCGRPSRAAGSCCSRWRWRRSWSAGARRDGSQVHRRAAQRSAGPWRLRACAALGQQH